MDVEVGMRIQVHYNLHKGGYSITGTVVTDPLSGRTAKRVIANVPTVTLRDVVFRVQPGGLARIRKTRQREVCAYSIGTIAEPVDIAGLRKVTFNPHRTDSFVYADTGERIDSAPLVVFSGAYAWV